MDIDELLKKHPSAGKYVNKYISAGDAMSAWSFLNGIDTDADTSKEFYKKVGGTAPPLGKANYNNNPNAKWFAGPDFNSRVQIEGDLIDDAERGFKGYRVKDLTSGSYSYAPADSLFDTQKEADESIFERQRAANKAKAAASNNTGTTTTQPPPPPPQPTPTPEPVNNTGFKSFTNHITEQQTRAPFIQPGLDKIRNTSSPIAGLKANGLSDMLKQMGVYVVDAETTGLKAADRMFSAAYSKIDMNTGGAEFTNEKFFRPNSVKQVNIKTLSPEQVEREYKRRLEKAHSSEVFGARQAAEGSLDEAAKAMAEGRTVKPATFLRELGKELDTNANGNVIFTHNSNFENSQFEKLNNGDNKTYTNQYNAMAQRNGGNNIGLFGADKNISNWTKNADNAGLSQRIKNAHDELTIARKGFGDNSAEVRGALGKYAAANTDNMNYLFDQMRSVQGKAGSYVNIDTMHFIKGLMSYGALNGDVDLGNLQLGGKVEHQALAWLKRKETHQAGDDTRVQGKIAHKLMAEVEAYAKDPSRKSPLLAELNQFINENNVATQTFKSSITSEISNTSKYKTKDDYIKGVYDWIDQASERYSTASGDVTERADIAKQVKAQFGKLDAEGGEKLSKERLANDMEKWIASTFESPQATREASEQRFAGIQKQSVDFLKKHKGKAAIAGLLVGASVLAGGGEEGKGEKYNTYDELYNNQYYGSGFADWQNRNNAHRILY